MRYVFSTEQPKRYRFPTHINDLVMDRAEATTSEVFLVEMGPGEAPPLHIHEDMEQIFYVLRGRGQLEIGGESERFPVAPGDVVRIPPSTWHRIFCEGVERLQYVAVDCFLAGPPEAEPTWESHVQVVCDGRGWNFDEVAGGASSG